MTIKYVEFTDEAETKILTSFSCPQPWPEYYPHQGTVEDTDARWLEFMQRLNPEPD